LHFLKIILLKETERSNCFVQKINEEAQFCIFIGWSEWLFLQKFISCKRKKFLTPFTRLLNLRFKKENLNCYLKSNNNYFSTTKSTPPKNYWRGFYKCTHESCPGKFIATIENIEERKDVLINVLIAINPISHIENEIKFQIKGKERINLAKDLIINGTLAVQAENTVFNNENKGNFESIVKILYFISLRKQIPFLDFTKIPKITKSTILKMIKSNFRNYDKLSSNVFEDVRTAKTIFDNSEKRDFLNGYIQIIKSDPFGFSLLCENQVKVNLFFLGLKINNDYI
jgi:hypothetical protein